MDLCLNFLKVSGKIILPLAFLLLSLSVHGFSNSNYNERTASVRDKNNKFLRIDEYLQIFYPIENSAEYSVTICADLPDNNNPNRVYRKGEPGHVFLILSKFDRSTGDLITRSFGFYPRVAVSCLFKKVRSKILDNSNREYDAAIEKKLTNDEFALLLDKCIEFSKKKYNLKKYNCYEYVLEVFNSISGIEKLPVTKVKFPFIFGRGGSPCGLYSDLKKLVATGTSLAPFIRFGLFKSPVPRLSPNSIVSNQKR